MNKVCNKFIMFEGMVQKDSVLGLDSDWQYPAITEKHAFTQCLKLLPSIPNVIYFAFPWATLIDKLMRNVPADRLIGALECMKARTQAAKAVVTVCQHIHMLTHQHIFAKTGITHVFWTHAVRGQSTFHEDKNIKIFPFPLFPVQSPGVGSEEYYDKEHLYSFVGAKANKWYLTQSRNIIIDNLSIDGRGLVIGRDQWHYNKIVYDHQIHAKTEVTSGLIDQEATREYKKILEKSIFSLCPSGTGPNSIRLWESIGYGSIPVVLADTYLHPGDDALWEEATISCGETLKDILALPNRLESLAHDSTLLERKRHAMRQLWQIYGPNCFIYDIQQLFLSLAGETESLTSKRASFTYDTLLRLASEINCGYSNNLKVLDFFLLSCTSRILSEPSVFMTHYRQEKEFSKAYKVAIKGCSSKCTRIMSRVLEHRQMILV